MSGQTPKKKDEWRNSVSKMLKYRMEEVKWTKIEGLMD